MIILSPTVGVNDIILHQLPIVWCYCCY